MLGCDCDGVSRQQLDLGIEGHAIRASLSVIERVAGHRPPTCPWRAFYDPLVQDVLAVSPHAKRGNLSAALGPDPDNLVVQGVSVYQRAVDATEADEGELRSQEREAKRKALEAARKAGVRG